MSRASAITSDLLDRLHRKLPDREVHLAPDDAFFCLRVELPEGLSRGDMPDFVGLAIEAKAPFPMEQLAHGFLVDQDKGYAFAFAAHKGRLQRLGIENTGTYFQLFPSFVVLYGMQNAEATVRFLVNETTLSALFFPAGATAPEQLRATSLEEGDLQGESNLLAARDRFLKELDTEGYKVEDGLAEVVQAEVLPNERIRFHLRSIASDRDPVMVVKEPLNREEDLWAADLRDPAFAEKESAARRRSRSIWQSLRIGVGVAALLLLFQLLTLGLSGYNLILENRITELEPQATRVENKLTLASRLTQSTEEDLQPFVLLEAINPLRPDSVYFDEVRSRAYNQLQVEGLSSQGVTPVNAFADSIRQLEFVDSVENNAQTRNNQTSFELVIMFSATPPAPEGGFTIPDKAEEDAEEGGEETG
ncbi:MAG: hypothetical protein GVY10_11470 [Verrucomicrobia bacterium]|jgi:Tfp pilus assembly protein PilN|nr:hypothetical protein [Verrucomicrobiota bacterium]